MKYFFKLTIPLFLIITNSHTSFSNDDSKKHNILFISVDDFRPEINSYGVGKMITPNIDKLAL